VSNDIRDKIGLEEEWTRNHGTVLRRWRFIGDEVWSDWEITAHLQVPFTVLDKFTALDRIEVKGDEHERDTTGSGTTTED